MRRAPLLAHKLVILPELRVTVVLVRRPPILAHKLAILIEQSETGDAVRRLVLLTHNLAGVVELRFAVVKSDLCELFRPLWAGVRLNAVSKLLLDEPIHVERTRRVKHELNARHRLLP